MNVSGRCLLCMQTTGCKAEYFTTAGYFYKTSTSVIEFVSRQPNIVDLFRSFELACQCMETLKRGWYHIHSHQHCPSSVLCLCCPSICVVLGTTNCTVCLPAAYRVAQPTCGPERPGMLAPFATPRGRHNQRPSTCIVLNLPSCVSGFGQELVSRWESNQ